MSTEVIESGPFTSLEQSMLASSLVRQRQVHGFGFYNAVAAVCGSVGALAAGLPQILEDHWSSAPQPSRWFLLFVPSAILGAFIARSLSPSVEQRGGPGRSSGLQRSRS